MDSFTLSFVFKDREFNLETKFVRMGYVHQFHIHLDERSFIFEFDEEQNYRVIDTSLVGNPIEEGLVEAIAEKVGSLHI